MDLSDKLRDELTSWPWLRLAVLFGSHARRSATARSDVDIAVLGVHSLGEMQALEAALGRVAGRSVDLVDLATSPPQLRFEIARDGVLLFARGTEEWGDFRARAMLDWWDWGPTARRMYSDAARRLQERL